MRTQHGHILAIILSAKRVTVAQASLVDGQVRVSAVGDIEPPEGAFDGNQIANGAVLGREISALIAERQMTARNAVMFLPGPTAITQLIKLPTMPREDMLGAVRAVAERYAVFAEHSIVVDCSVVKELEEGGKEMSSVLFAAAREANIEQCQDCARAAGLELLSVEAAPAAAARAYQERIGTSDVVAVAVVGEVKTDVMIFDEGVCHLCYSANAGLPEEGEEGEWVAPRAEEGGAFVPPPQLYSELTHCFRFFQNQFPRRAVQRVILAADHPEAEATASHLAKELELPVELGRPGTDVSLPAELEGGSAALSRVLSLALIRGAALSAGRGSDALFPINLIPVSTSVWVPARPYIKLAVVVMGVVLLACSVWALSLRSKIATSERRLSSLELQIAALEPEIEALRAAEATELALRTEVERQTARIARERAVRWSQILVDIAARLPRDMWLTRVASPDSSRISLTGVSTNRETIPRAIESLSGSPYLQNVVLGSLTKDDVYARGRVVIRYQINARLLRGLLPPARSARAVAEAGAGAGLETPAGAAAAREGGVR
ncbi:MAG: pilus assembly protein PilM [Armatimonadota bacterium]|nr:MAG: pilus assembly protein PilM [Armatimonadota bacterium]